jgi:hypothetical protein
MDLVIENGISGSTVTSRAPGAVDVAARTPTEITAATPATGTVAAPFDTALFRYSAPENAKVTFSVLPDNPDAQLGIALLPASGSFADLIAYDLTVNVPAGPSADYYLVLWDGSGQSGYGFELTASETLPDEHEPNNDYMTAASTSYANPLLLNIIPAGDEDWFAVDVEAGGTLTATISDGEIDECGSFFGGTIDSEIEILDVDGTTSLMFNDDDSASGTYCSSATIVAPAAGTYFVRAAASAAYCAGCEYDYTLTIDVTPP